MSDLKTDAERIKLPLAWAFAATAAHRQAAPTAAFSTRNANPGPAVPAVLKHRAVRDAAEQHSACL